MKFPELEIQNFMAITSAKIDLSDRGLVAIQGVNNADSSASSNGAGKSSIADALCWCWFGVTARDATGDDVVNRENGKDCFVTSHCVDGDNTYIATRHRRHKKFKNRLHLHVKNAAGVITDLTKGTDALTQVEANKVIGSSINVFTGSIYAGQEKMPDLPAMTDSALKSIIEEAAGITLLGEAYKKARESLLLATTDHKFSGENVERLKDRLKRSKATMEEQTRSISDWNAKSASRISELRRNALALKNALSAANKKLAAMNTKSVIEKLNQVNIAIASVESENETRVNMLKEESLRSSELSVAEAAVSAMEAASRRAVKNKDSVESSIGKPCSECGREITASEISAKRSSADSSLKAATDNINEAVEKRYQARVKLTNQAIKRESYEKTMTDMSEVSAEKVRLEGELMNARQAAQDIKDIQNQIEVEVANIKREQDTENPHTASLERTKAEIVKEIAEYKSAIAQTEMKEKLVFVMKQVVRVYSPSGVRARILDNDTPFLNKQTAKYLSVLSDGNMTATWSTLTPAAKKGEFKEKFSVDVVSATGGSNFKTLSGGEKRRVRIATALALQDLVSTRASKPIELFIGDEIDDALDPPGLERLMIILEEKAKERGSVFVISHNNLSDEISQTLTIEKTNAGETVVTEDVS